MNKFSEKNSGYILGMLIGAAAGGIAGAIIVNSLNYETLDLLSVRDKDKKNKLIKFIRQK